MCQVVSSAVFVICVMLVPVSNMHVASILLLLLLAPKSCFFLNRPEVYKDVPHCSLPDQFRCDNEATEVGMSTYKLYYFPVTGIAEQIRLLFAYGRINFVDARVDLVSEWPELKPSM